MKFITQTKMVYSHIKEGLIRVYIFRWDAFDSQHNTYLSFDGFDKGKKLDEGLAFLIASAKMHKGDA